MLMRFRKKCFRSSSFLTLLLTLVWMHLICAPCVAMAADLQLDSPTNTHSDCHKPDAQKPQHDSDKSDGEDACTCEAEVTLTEGHEYRSADSKSQTKTCDGYVSSMHSTTSSVALSYRGLRGIVSARAIILPFHSYNVLLI